MVERENRRFSHRTKSDKNNWKPYECSMGAEDIWCAWSHGFFLKFSRRICKRFRQEALRQ